jgi:hypothetical protein
VASTPDGAAGGAPVVPGGVEASGVPVALADAGPVPAVVTAATVTV